MNSSEGRYSTFSINSICKAMQMMGDSNKRKISMMKKTMMMTMRKMMRRI